jgi:hypothetical protein
MEKSGQNVTCCPVFDADRWNEQICTWENKQFIRGTIPQMLHLIFPGLFSRLKRKLWKQAVEASAEPDSEDFMILTHDLSAWKGEVFMPVTRTVPGADNVTISGTYFTKVFNGSVIMLPQYMNEMDILLSRKDKLAKRYFFSSSACPFCERKYAANSIVAFAEI